MSDTPSYLGLLNAISVNETAAGAIFERWAERTEDPDLAGTLRFVALRESEHGLAFAKRMLELGFAVRAPDDEPQRRFREVVDAELTDAETLEAMRFDAGPPETDVFDGMFADKTIDPVTGGLLGRYIAEERDTGWRLQAAYDRLVAEVPGRSA